MERNNTKKFFQYVIPSVLAFALSGVYTIVDGFFIGNNLGDLGLAAITIGYPVSALVGAVGTGIGLSGAIRFTILGAQGRDDKRRECFSGTTVLMIIVSLLLTAALFGLTEPILSLLGAEGDVLKLSTEYARVIALGAVFQLLATGFVPFIRNMGGASFAMVAMILGFVTNVILDYTMVWVLEWGMTGAALATIIGQAVTMIASVIFFIVKKSGWKLPRGGELTSLWREVIKVSLSPFGLTFSPTLTMLFMNRFLLYYGGAVSVAVYGCIGYITSIIYLLLQGVGDGCQPLMSEYYGEGGREALRRTLRLAYITSMAITVICMVGVFVSRGQIGMLFGASAEANLGTARYLPYFLATLPFLAFVRMTTSYFYATEKTKLSYLLVYAEPICTLVFLLILPLLIKLTGVWLAVPLAQIAAFGAAIAAKAYSRRQASARS